MDYKELFNWYQKNARILPFRQTKDPYAIWISEIMLQQTQVDTVVPYFNRFLKKYPNPSILSKTDLEIVLKDVEGLGYYRRFRNMHQTAMVIDHQLNGKFPSTYDEIIKLPGIGNYTAGAISSIAYNQAHSALDGNVIRVLSRYLKDDGDMRLDKNRKRLDKINQLLVENSKNPHDYTQSMMELGAVICRPQNPQCSICPINKECLAYQDGSVQKYPVMSKKAKAKIINYIVFMVKSKHGYYLRKRTESLLEGL